MTITFAPGGSAVTNAAATPACTDAPNSAIFLTYLFEDGATFTETGNDVVLYGKNKLTSLRMTKSGSGDNLVLRWQEDIDLSSRAIKTTYTHQPHAPVGHKAG